MDLSWGLYLLLILIAIAYAAATVLLLTIASTAGAQCQREPELLWERDADGGCHYNEARERYDKLMNAREAAIKAMPTVALAAACLRCPTRDGVGIVGYPRAATLMKNLGRECQTLMRQPRDARAELHRRYREMPLRPAGSDLAEQHRGVRRVELIEILAPSAVSSVIPPTPGLSSIVML